MGCVSLLPKPLGLEPVRTLAETPLWTEHGIHGDLNSSSLRKKKIKPWRKEFGGTSEGLSTGGFQGFLAGPQRACCRRKAGRYALRFWLVRPWGPLRRGLRSHPT